MVGMMTVEDVEVKANPWLALSRADISRLKLDFVRPELLGIGLWVLTSPSSEQETVPGDFLSVRVSSDSSHRQRYCLKQLCNNTVHRYQVS